MADKPVRLNELHRSSRRDFIRQAVAGTAVVGLGGALYHFASDSRTREARAETRPDGRPRLPPGQRVLEQLRPMGGRPGEPSLRDFRLRVHGAVKEPVVLTYADLLKLPQVEQTCDVHCVTGWSVLGALWKGVRVSALADKVGVKGSARHVIFEAAHGYTANVPLAEATKPNVLVTYRLDGKPLPRKYGAPVRSLVPDLYFWKSAKYLTGVRFASSDEPGYWEVRGYHNHGDPWKEERYG